MKKKTNVPAASQKEGYTPTEVGTMLEGIHKEIKVIAEGHLGLDNRMEKLEVAVHGNTRRLDMLEVRASAIDFKVSRLEDAVSKNNKDIALLDNKVSALDDKVTGLDTKVAGLDTKIAGAEENLKKEIRELGRRLITVETRA